ncbi:hypothetical protein G3O08_14110 [Cryomorpha ignava]|uniref:Uncharacterized protein n=1 Tax=Cryomorpha ignava TaxID=101383 RepID=A0A7K3WSH1_9FLAO|nr:hypothetical protein [Cryomorpha ignava]NEN24637.1 hypothetical protein [Cryomorpha ignava]
MKRFYILFTIILLFLGGYGDALAQLTIKGTIYSESIAIASVVAQGITSREDVYLAPPKKKNRDGLVYYECKYEIPWRIEKGIDHVIKFNDGLVEKIIYISGVVPKGINPKQKFIIDVDLIENDEPDMTLIVFWSMTSSSYKALPLSQLPQIREEAHPDFFWNDGSAPDSGDIRRSSY